MTTPIDATHHLGFPIETVAVFAVLSIGAIFIDLHAHRDDKPMSLKSASLWTVFWIVISLAFAGFLAWHHGATAAKQRACSSPVTPWKKCFPSITSS